MLLQKILIEKFGSTVLVKGKLQFGQLQMHSGPDGLVHGTSVFDSLISPKEGRIWAGAIPLHVVDILLSFVGPSVCLFVEKFTPMGSDFDKHGEEVKTHPLAENLDDAGEYIPVRGMTKEKVLALPHPIRSHCHESFGVCENHSGLVVGERVFEGQACCRKFGPARRATAGASTHPSAYASFGIVSVKACSHSHATFRTVRGVNNPREVVDVHRRAPCPPSRSILLHRIAYPGDLFRIFPEEVLTGRGRSCCLD